MKQFATVSFVTLILITPIVFSRIQYYGIDAFVNPEGKTFFKLTLTFLYPQKKFDFKIFAKIEEFNVSSNAGPVKCKIAKGEATLISCEMNLTKQKRTLKIFFTTKDFVKSVDNKYYLSTDLSLNKEINSLFASFKLSEGFLISEKNGTPQIFPKNATILSDGRRIIVNWNFQNVKVDDPIKFEIFYEPVKKIIIPFNQIVLIGVISVVLTFLLIYKKTKKTKELIFSVLDKYERKVLEMISSAGQIKQKKIVQSTNLSKAKVSRIVKKLAERGLIKVERRGRTNILKIVKRKLGL